MPFSHSEFCDFYQEEDTIRATLNLSADHPCFSGHFSGNPIFPGVAQVEIVANALEKAYARLIVVRSIRNGKFLMKITPGMRLNLSIATAGGSAAWMLKSDHGVCSKGQLSFHLSAHSSDAGDPVF